MCSLVEHFRGRCTDRGLEDGLRPNTEYIDAESSMQDHLIAASSKS
jgi:hypothetical protein